MNEFWLGLHPGRKFWETHPRPENFQKFWIRFPETSLAVFTKIINQNCVFLQNQVTIEQFKTTRFIFSQHKMLKIKFKIKDINFRLNLLNEIKIHSFVSEEI